MSKAVMKVAMRQQKLFVDVLAGKNPKHQLLQEDTSVLVANARKLGFGFSEPLLDAINNADISVKATILDTLKEVKGVNKNWTPLVKGWDKPTGESTIDYIVTLLANLTKSKRGTLLPCQHRIPKNTFPLERYNGCPFCKTPFEFGEIENYGQGSTLQILDLWTDKEMRQYFHDLLESKVALDATQIDSLRSLLAHYQVPKEVKVEMKETLMVVIEALVVEGKTEKAATYFSNPNDILRYLWYKHTGFLQIVQPKTIVYRKTRNMLHFTQPRAVKARKRAEKAAKKEMKLKYSRKECRIVAQWLNDLDLSAQQACEIMHPKRNMWIRFIRALRLVEYSKKKGFDNLKTLLDKFHKEEYEVFQGRVDHFRLQRSNNETFALLKQRPGIFARSLFANMLWLGPKSTISNFKEITDKIPTRLLLTLNMYAPLYFTKDASRSVKPLGSTRKEIPANPRLNDYADVQLKWMQKAMEDVCVEALANRFAKMENPNEKVYIAEGLEAIPMAIGERSETIQDVPSALMGTRFRVLGQKVRLFMQWGTGLPAQHLDMDLSCKVAYPDKTEYCSYDELTITGCQHSGDIINIPDKVGTAEYIEIDVDLLTEKGAKYVSFTCNAYSMGSISPNLVVGWMDSQHPMKISEKTGVAYDPSTVQHQVRITQGLTKGLVFGVLDIENRAIVWLEMAFEGQIVQNLSLSNVEALLRKLDSRSKLSVGHLLNVRAKAQNLNIVDDPAEADEVYDLAWARNTAAVTALLLPE